MCEMPDSFADAVRGQNQVVEQWKRPYGSLGRKSQPQVLHGTLLHGAAKECTEGLTENAGVGIFQIGAAQTCN